MKDDFEIIQHHFDNDIVIYPISDIHLGAYEHCTKAWNDFCDTIKNTPNAYVMLGGDLVNNSVRTVGFTNPYDEKLRPRDQKHMMVKMLEPIKDRILCAVTGNHEERSIKDDDYDITYDIMAKLDLEDLYRRNIAFVKITCGTSKNSACYTFGITHGAGGGIYTGATVNRNERFGNVLDGVDCLIVGHTHKGTITKPNKVVFDRTHNRVIMKPYTVISSVSWLNYGGYALRKMLLPSHVAEPQKILLKAGTPTQSNIEIRW